MGFVCAAHAHCTHKHTHMHTHAHTPTCTLHAHICTHMHTHTHSLITTFLAVLRLYVSFSKCCLRTKEEQMTNSLNHGLALLTVNSYFSITSFMNCLSIPCLEKVYLSSIWNLKIPKHVVCKTHSALTTNLIFDKQVKCVE